MYPMSGIDGGDAQSADRSDSERRGRLRQAAPVAVAACFDWLGFVESLGDEELAAEIVALFIVETPAMLNRVRDAVARTRPKRSGRPRMPSRGRSAISRESDRWKRRHGSKRWRAGRPAGMLRRS